MGVSDRLARGGCLRDGSVWDLRPPHTARRRRSLLSDLARRPGGDAAGTVRRDPLQPGRAADRSPGAGQGALAVLLDSLVRAVARMPTGIHAKLIAAFLAMVALLITLGAVGLQVLSASNSRAEELVLLQRKIAAYRQLQSDTTEQLYSVASALLVPDDATLDATLRQLSQFG